MAELLGRLVIDDHNLVDFFMSSSRESSLTTGGEPELPKLEACGSRQVIADQREQFLSQIASACQ
jgi:hypothetical protein